MQWQPLASVLGGERFCLLEDADLLPHEQRVVDELADLDGKISRLVNFFSTDVCKYILQRERDALTIQLGVMRSYADILRMRIKNFSLPEKA